MVLQTLLLVSAGIFVIAVLYSSIGHAGASGYIAVMSLFAMSPELIKPAALSLNILVASIGFWQFWRGGHFSWSLCWPFIVLSIPFAFLGGYVNLPTRAFQIVLGLLLLIAAVRFGFEVKLKTEPRAPSTSLAMGSGGGIGFLAGLTGTGGGIFLSPLILSMRWATAKKMAAITTVFILANSISGLAGNITLTYSLPTFALPFMLAAVVGGSIGSYLGSFLLPDTTIKRALAVVLLIAGTKLILFG